MTQHRRRASQQPGSRLWELLVTATGTLVGRGWGFREIGSDELRFPATIYVWVRWFICIAYVFQLVYRPEFTYFTYGGYIFCLIVLIAANVYSQYCIRSDRGLTLRCMLGLNALDVALITAAMVVGGGFNHFFFYLLYYPVLAWFAVFFNSFKLSFAWVTLVAFIYTAVSLTVGEGLDFEARDEKALIARIVVMYAVVASVSLVARSERRKKLAAVRRERELHRQRIEMSQTIHDTTAQSAYTLGLGLEDAIEKTDSSNPELAGKLEAMWALTKSTMWALRHPINGGQIFSGSELSEVLAEHVDTFTDISSIPADLKLHGVEPQLSTITRSLLFSIAHNAMTNALRHSNADNVTLSLEFGAKVLCMSVSDDGIGLPDNYALRGHGFRNMRADAERMGGTLDVETNGKGTIIRCTVPTEQD